MRSVLITGITGSIGSALAARLCMDGEKVRGFSRDASRVTLDVPVVEGDAITGAGLDAALDGVQIAYFLIHSMERIREGGSDPFAVRELGAAERFAAAAQAAGVERVVYLGGLVPSDHDASPHLASRLDVERLLLEQAPGATALRASIVVSASSRSFRFLVHLIERMPVLALPAWRTNRTAPVDGRDAIELLVRAGRDGAARGRSLDVAGPEVVSYGELVERIRDAMLVGRPSVRLRRATLTPIASRVAAAITGEQHELIGPLMEGLESDLLPRDATPAAELLGVRLHSLDAAIERALRDWEAREPLAAR